ncbi:hypothetical protein DV736_g3149, partial [Chaetothyriales sp. CBS 134916]
MASLRALCRSPFFSSAPIRSFASGPLASVGHLARPSHQRQHRSNSSFLPVPFVTESLGSVTHTTDLFSRLLRERIIAIYGEIDDRLAATVTASLLFLEADDPSKPINLYINSPGGSVTAGLAIYDTCQYITPEISTICLGQAASMGSLLLAGGSPGKRFALPHSSIMLHQPSGGYFGTAADIAIHAKEILRIRKQLNEIYQRHLTAKAEDGSAKAKLTVDDIEKMMERDYFLSAREALELGVVDEIMPSRKESSSTLEQPIYGFPPFSLYDFDSGVGEPKLAPYQKSPPPPTPSSVFCADDERIRTLAEATRQEWIQHAHQSRAVYLADVEEEAKRTRHLEWCVRSVFERGSAGAGEEEAVSTALDMSAFLEPQEGEEEGMEREEGAGMTPPLPSPQPFPAQEAFPPRKRARMAISGREGAGETASSNILSSSTAAGNPRLPLPLSAAWSQVPVVPVALGHAYCPVPMNMPPLPPSQPAVDQWQQWPKWQQLPTLEPILQAPGPCWFGDPLPEWQAGQFVPVGPWEPFGGWGVQAQGPASELSPQFQSTWKRGRQNKPRATGQGRRNDLY